MLTSAAFLCSPAFFVQIVSLRSSFVLLVVYWPVQDDHRANTYHRRKMEGEGESQKGIVIYLTNFYFSELSSQNRRRQTDEMIGVAAEPTWKKKCTEMTGILPLINLIAYFSWSISLNLCYFSTPPLLCCPTRHSRSLSCRSFFLSPCPNVIKMYRFHQKSFMEFFSPTPHLFLPLSPSYRWRWLRFWEFLMLITRCSVPVGFFRAPWAWVDYFNIIRVFFFYQLMGVLGHRHHLICVLELNDIILFSTKTGHLSCCVYVAPLISI